MADIHKEPTLYIRYKTPYPLLGSVTCSFEDLKSFYQDAYEY